MRKKMRAKDDRPLKFFSRAERMDTPFLILLLVLLVVGLGML